jgi:LIM and senescent cell antigen-like-containing domain protein 1/2
MEHNQKAYCMYHYNEVTGSLCGTCYEPASGKDVVDAMGKKFCEGHFVCAGCQTNLMGAGNKFGEWDNKPLCTRCWNALPLDIRKRLNEYLKIEKKVGKEMAK